MYISGEYFFRLSNKNDIQLHVHVGVLSHLPRRQIMSQICSLNDLFQSLHGEWKNNYSNNLTFEKWAEQTV